MISIAIDIFDEKKRTWDKHRKCNKMKGLELKQVWKNLNLKLIGTPLSQLVNVKDSDDLQVVAAF